MKIGFLFPGQGSQTIGMGKDLYEKYPEYREMYEKVKKITKVDIAKLTYEASEEELNQTKNTQICILTMSLAILEILKKYNIKADISMGLSLGEYTALIYGKSILVEDGIKIVQKRGQLMQELCPKGDWSMAAIIGLDEANVNKACQSTKSGFVVPANYNCIGQIAISGEKKAVEEACGLAKEKGAKKTIMLKTSGPFHTIMLEEASEALKNELNKIEIKDPEIKIIKNLDGKPYKKEDDIKEVLAKHIINPVRFTDSIEEMIKEKVDTFVEIGPGKTLSAFIKKAAPDAKIFSVNGEKGLQELKKYLRKEK